MATAEDILKVAKSQIGNNGDKYCKEYGTKTAWCVIFVWWVFKHANASDLFGKKCALCSKLYYQHESQAVEFDQLQAGDVVFFDWSGEKKAFNHVGLVESRSGSYINTVEGNASNAVRKRTRSKKYVSHAYRPAYDNNSTTKDTDDFNGGTTVNIEMKVLKNGSSGYQVKTLQRLLMSYGFNLSPYGIDGKFGNLTETRLKEYQQKNGLTADGICGANTWDKLLKG